MDIMRTYTASELLALIKQRNEDAKAFMALGMTEALDDVDEEINSFYEKLEALEENY